MYTSVLVACIYCWQKFYYNIIEATYVWWALGERFSNVLIFDRMVRNIQRTAGSWACPSFTSYQYEHSAPSHRFWVANISRAKLFLWSTGPLTWKPLTSPCSSIFGHLINICRICTSGNMPLELEICCTKITRLIYIRQFSCWRGISMFLMVFSSSNFFLNNRLVTFKYSWASMCFNPPQCLDAAIVYLGLLTTLERCYRSIPVDLITKSLQSTIRMQERGNLSLTSMLLQTSQSSCTILWSCTQRLELSRVSSMYGGFTMMVDSLFLYLICWQFRKATLRQCLREHCIGLNFSHFYGCTYGNPLRERSCAFLRFLRALAQWSRNSEVWLHFFRSSE